MIAPVHSPSPFPLIRHPARLSRPPGPLPAPNAGKRGPGPLAVAPNAGKHGILAGRASARPPRPATSDAGGGVARRSPPPRNLVQNSAQRETRRASHSQASTLTAGIQQKRSRRSEQNNKKKFHKGTRCALSKKEGCNTRTSQEVTHPSTTLAQARLTSEF